jgi:hypothetical protein
MRCTELKLFLWTNSLEMWGDHTADEVETAIQWRMEPGGYAERSRV